MSKKKYELTREEAQAIFDACVELSELVATFVPDYKGGIENHLFALVTKASNSRFKHSNRQAEKYFNKVLFDEIAEIIKQ